MIMISLIAHKLHQDFHTRPLGALLAAVGSQGRRPDERGPTEGMFTRTVAGRFQLEEVLRLTRTVCLVPLVLPVRIRQSPIR